MGLFVKNRADKWASKGYALAKLERFDEALDAYDRAITIDPKQAVGWSNKGYALVKLQRYYEALEACDCAIKIDPKQAVGWSNKGYALVKLQRFEEALVAYERAIKIDPKNAAAWNNKGYALNKLQRYLEAVKAYDQAIRIDPKYAGAWNNKGIALNNMQRYEEALKAYGRAIDIDPDDAEQWDNEGNTLDELQRYDQALEAYVRAITIDPTNTVLWSNKGNTLYALQRYEEAQTCCDKALELTPTNSKAQKLKTEISDIIRGFDPFESDPLDDTEIQPLKKVSLIIERTIFDPVTTGFLLSSKRDLPNVRQWIMSHDPTSYWYVVCIKNPLNRPVDEWGISLEMGKAVGISDIFIANRDDYVGVDEYTDKEKPWVKKFNFGFSRHDGVVIPRDGSLRLYIKMHSKACNVDVRISGKFVAEGFKSIEILEKRFTFACDVQNYKTALTANPEKAKNMTENVLKRSFDPDTARVLLHAFNQIRDINQCCSQQRYDLLLDKMRALDDLFEKASAPERVHKMLSNNIRAVEMLEDGEETYERVERLWSSMLDMWQNEYIM